MPIPTLEKIKNPELVKGAIREVYQLAGRVTDKLGRKPVLMEVCGTHTMTISKSGLRGILKNVAELKSGPGCPVCVTSQEDIDRLIEISRLEKVAIATFGDMIRVPGSRSTLEKERGLGATIKIIYSPLEALSWAINNPDQEVVLLGVGFETTAPAVALCMSKAVNLGIKNFSVLSMHKTMPEVLKRLLKDKETMLDGLILPGHVCAITGRKPFDFIADYGVSAAVSGFEPLDVLGAMKIILGQILEEKCEVANGYQRLVSETGNEPALGLLKKYFVPGNGVWRGLGSVPNSGLNISLTYRSFDAAFRFPVEIPPIVSHAGCRCGELLKGKIEPSQCPLFGSKCIPKQPIGPCMVSSEGACAAYYYFERNEEVPHE
ncbi:MAG: hydrogenase formation protein HypD [Dehalobacterium sp.]